MREKRCPVCGKDISGREGKRFCSLQCKNSYHNKKFNAFLKERRKITEILAGNYAILSSLLECERTSEKIEALKEMGFKAEYMTGCTRIRNHTVLRCYDIEYRKSALKIFNIRKVQS